MPVCKVMIGMVKKTLGFFLGLIIGGVATFFFESKDSDAPPSSFPIMHRQGYTIAYDTRAKIPYWTREHLTKESLQKNADRTDMSFLDEMI